MLANKTITIRRIALHIVAWTRLIGQFEVPAIVGSADGCHDGVVVATPSFHTTTQISMERLLGTAFDNLTSSDPYITKRGLRHIEALLAKLCLGKDTARLKDDDALREFLRLQERFEWNICQRLIAFLELYDPEQSDKGSAAAVGALHLLQGLLLLHTQSRNLFARETHMSLLLDLLDASSPPEVQSAALHALVCALVDTPANLRVSVPICGVTNG